MTFHTVEEAKTKWCPHVRVQVVGGVMNRIWQKLIKMSEKKDRLFMQEQEDACKCIGSDCMMWQWMTNTQCGAGAGIGRDGRTEWPKNGSRTADGDPTPPAAARGYCGLVK